MKIPPFFPPKKIGLLRVNKRSTFDGNRYLIFFLEKNLLKTNIDKQNSRVVFERNGRQFSFFFRTFQGPTIGRLPALLLELAIRLASCRPACIDLMHSHRIWSTQHFRIGLMPRCQFLRRRVRLQNLLAADKLNNFNCTRSNFQREKANLHAPPLTFYEKKVVGRTD